MLLQNQHARLTLPILPYSILFLAGLRLRNTSSRSVLGVAFAAGMIFAATGWYLWQSDGAWVSVQDYKYPPRFYYASYAIFASLLVYLLCCRMTKYLPTSAVTAVAWISNNSLWIYLWHIFATVGWDLTIGKGDGTLAASIIKTSFIFGSGAALTAGMNKALGTIWKKNTATSLP